MEEQDLKCYLESNGYLGLRQVPGRGWCGVDPNFIFYRVLCYGMDEFGREGLYFFIWTSQALESLKIWSGQGDPPGMWLKHRHKGQDFSNPALMYHTDRTKWFGELPDTHKS